MNIQRDIFPQRGAESTSSPKFALPVIDQTAAQFISNTFTAGTDFTVPSGVAGASVKIQLPQRPILGNFGRTGSFGNTTLVLAGAIATTLATEVAFIADSSNQGGDVTTLSNGQFMVDYETATIYGKRADNATTGTAAYGYLAKGSVSGTGANANQVQGNAASGATDSGNPVKIGGVYNSTQPTFTTGQRGDAQVDQRGNLKVAIYTRDGVTGAGVGVAGVDSLTNSQSGLVTYSLLSSYNGTTWDRIRSGQTTPTTTLTGFTNSLPWAIYHTSPTARTDGQGGPAEADANGNLQTNLNSLISGEFQGASQSLSRMRTSRVLTPTRITTATTTTVVSGGGSLGMIFIESVLTGTVTFSDNGVTKLILPVGTPAGSNPLNFGFTVDCTIVTSAADRIVVGTEPN